MKKLILLFSFLIAFSQVSFSQIWESDTLPWHSGGKRTYNMFKVQNNNTFGFIYPGGGFSYYSSWSNNFGASFLLSKAKISSFDSRFQPTQSDSKVIGLMNDTLAYCLDLDLYERIDNNVNNKWPEVFVDSGRRYIGGFGKIVTINYFNPFIGVRPLDLDFIRSIHIFSSSSAIVSLVSSGSIGNINGRRDTLAITGIIRRNTPFRVSQIETKYAILDYHFINDNAVGYCGGFANYLGKTFDGGLTWRKLRGPLKADWSDIFFADSLNGWAYGFSLRDSSNYIGIPVAQYTPDGGNTWFQIACDTNFAWGKKWFNSQGFGWALRTRRGAGPGRDTSQLVKTTNYGNSWTVQLSSITERLEDMVFVDTANGLILANQRNISGNPPSKIYIKTSSTLGTFTKYLPKLEAYPNPTTGRLRLRGLKETEGVSLRLFNNQGQEVWKGSLSTEGEIDISNLPTGLYHLEALNAQGQRWSTRVVRE